MDCESWTREDCLRDIQQTLDSEFSRGLLLMYRAPSPESVFERMPVTLANLPKYRRGHRSEFRQLARLAAIELATKEMALVCSNSVNI
jgi:hypothetical protein